MTLSMFSHPQHYANKGQDTQGMFVVCLDTVSLTKQCHPPNTLNSATVMLCRNQSV